MKRRIYSLKLNKTILSILNLNHHNVLLIQNRKLLMIILNQKLRMNPNIIIH